MTGLYLLLLLPAILVAADWLGERLDRRSPAQRECDQLADRDLAARR
jgi:hypothetical protein